MNKVNNKTMQTDKMAKELYYAENLNKQNRIIIVNNTTDEAALLAENLNEDEMTELLKKFDEDERLTCCPRLP